MTEVRTVPCFLCESKETEPQARSSNPLLYDVSCQACGRYSISTIVIGLTLQNHANRKHLLSALTRQHSDAGNSLAILSENVQALLDSVPSSLTPLEYMNRVLLLIGQRQDRADKYINLRPQIDYPLVFAHDGRELYYLLETLEKQGLLEVYRGTGDSWRLTPAGWQRVIELQKLQLQSDQAFVAMWFSKDLSEAYEKGIKQALDETGFRPYRVDKEEHNEKIDDRIIAEIRHSGLLVADFTGHRGSVYFETGFAMGLGIHVIWTCRETDINNAHFDTRQYNHITWKDATDLKSKLKSRIEATIPGRTG